MHFHFSYSPEILLFLVFPASFGLHPGVALRTGMAFLGQNIATYGGMKSYISAEMSFVFQLYTNAVRCVTYL